MTDASTTDTPVFGQIPVATTTDTMAGAVVDPAPVAVEDVPTSSTTTDTSATDADPLVTPATDDEPIVIPATPKTPSVTVSDIPTITLPVTKATKAHITSIVAAVSGVFQVVGLLLPGNTPEHAYLAAGIGVVSVFAHFLGVYAVPNLPKITVNK
jgi:hypothetical protein